MRTSLSCKLLLGAALAALFAGVPASAQTVEQLAPRVSKLESEMRAVQRKVFPGGDKNLVPEITTPAAAPVETVGSPATSPVADLTARVDGLEREVRTLTGTVETLQFKQRQLEEALAKFRGDAEYRIGALETGARPAADVAPPPAAKPGAKTPAKGDTAKADTVKADAGKTDAAKTDAKLDPVEAAWRQAYAPVAAKDYAKAEPALLDFLSAYPKAPRAASAQYWLGRTYMAQGQSAQAAKAFLDGYQKYPKSDRGADSLIGLGGALTALKKPEQACKAYNELAAVYGAKLTTSQKDAVTKARATAKCDG
ncbi:MAG TPA: tetratricopeptide repeat protein [Polymorphobacter sp.]|nr:tetratricopeptide repeat protein [Polymorphobacter sp.]